MPKIERPSKKVKAEEVTRKVIYPEIEAEICVGEGAMTVQQAKDFLGWEEESESVKFGGDYLLTDREDRKIRCLNNVHNRPLYMSVCDALAQEHLMKRWKFNGEAIIIGKTGQILNGQHTLISLVLAEQERTGKQSAHWERYWEGPVTMEKMVIKGVEEDDGTVNTMDTCKPRSLADVIYRSAYFAKFKPSDRKSASRITDYAIRLLWHRTGAGLDAFAPRRTHAESLDFIDRHGKLLAAVKHIHEEESDHSISGLISLGSAAALLYLMGCSRSDGDEYRAGDPPNEKKLDWDNWDKAQEFWVLLSSNNVAMLEIRHAIKALHGVEGEQKGSADEKIAIICKAWKVYVAGHDLTRKDLKLKYTTDDEGIEHLAECPDFGGIDLGNPKDKETTSDVEEEEPTDPKEKAKADNRKKLAEELMKRRNADVVPEKGLQQELETLQAANPSKVLLFGIPSGYAFYSTDTDIVLKLTKGYKLEKYNKMDRVKIPAKDFADVTKILHMAGHKIGVVEVEDGKTVVKDVETLPVSSEAPNSPSPKPKPKAKAK